MPVQSCGAIVLMFLFQGQLERTTTTLIPDITMLACALVVASSSYCAVGRSGSCLPLLCQFSDLGGSRAAMAFSVGSNQCVPPRRAPWLATSGGHSQSFPLPPRVSRLAQAMAPAPQSPSPQRVAQSAAHRPEHRVGSERLPHEGSCLRLRRRARTLVAAASAAFQWRASTPSSSSSTKF